MKSLKTSQKKKCRYCRRVFTPDPRVGERQVSCKREECRAKRKKQSQKRWCQSNPDYFQDRYVYVKLWRERNPGYQKSRRRKQREIQDEIERKSSVKTISLSLPTDILKNEIQDEIKLKHKCNRGVTSIFVHEIQDEMDFTAEGP